MRLKLDARLLGATCCWAIGALGYAGPIPDLASKGEPEGILVGVFEARKTEIREVELPGGKHRVLRPEKKESGDPRIMLLAPDGVRLVFENHDSGIRAPNELRIVNRDGTGERVIVKALFGTDILWSPDGALLLVPALNGAKSGYVIDPDSNRFWTWPACGLERRPEFLRWTADGQGIFAWDDLGSFALLRCDFDGTVKAVGEFRGEQQQHTGHPVISPNEKSVLFVDYEYRHDGATFSVSDLAGASVRRVVNAANADRDSIVWSPDGRWIGGFARLRAPKTSHVKPRVQIIVANLDTGILRAFDQGDARALQWWAPGPPVARGNRAIHCFGVTSTERSPRSR